VLVIVRQWRPKPSAAAIPAHSRSNSSDQAGRSYRGVELCFRECDATWFGESKPPPPHLVGRTCPETGASCRGLLPCSLSHELLGGSCAELAQRRRSWSAAAAPRPATGHEKRHKPQPSLHKGPWEARRYYRGVGGGFGACGHGGKGGADACPFAPGGANWIRPLTDHGVCHRSPLRCCIRAARLILVCNGR
jgi:hypothetical protein